jgi:hypothetical protein
MAENPNHALPWERPLNVATINSRIDQALAENRRAERLIVRMATALFIVGLSAIFIAYWLKNPYIAAGSTLAQIFLVFPISEIRKLRRDNMILQIFPALIYSLPPDKAATQTVKLLDHLRGVRR